MADLGDVPWPPDAIETDRLLVRGPQARDRDGYIELMCSDDVQRYLGGPRPRDDVQRTLPAVPGSRPGVFTVEGDGAFLGTITVDRRDPDRPGHLRPQGNELEVGYLFLPTAWGNGYATEAVAAVLEWIADVVPREPVVVCTQSANEASMRLAARLGFVEIERFVEFDAEQWFGARIPEAQQEALMGEDIDTHVPVTYERSNHIKGPFYHGTKSALGVGDELVAGHGSNFQEGRVSNNIYFTTLVGTAAWGAELATALAGIAERGHIYVVEPLGPFEDDPNVTNKKFAGNPTESYRTHHALRIVGEVDDWEGHDPEVLKGMLHRLALLREQGLDVIED